MANNITRWEQVIGSQNQIRIVLNAMKREVLPHFILYTGNSGIGKSTIAMLTAKSLLCLNPNEKTGEPCYVCESCKSMDEGTHRSYKKINMPEMCRKEDINEQIKDIFQFQKISDKTVYVLEEIHDLKPELQRPLLEPLTDIPKDVYIISCTTAQYKLIPELVSRALRLELQNPTPKECIGYVATLAQEFGVNIYSMEAVEKFAELCDYNPRLIADTLKVVATDNNLTEESLAAMFNSVRDEDVKKFLSAFVISDTITDIVRMYKDLEGISLNRLTNKSVEVLFSAILYRNSGEEPDTHNTLMLNFITKDLAVVSEQRLAQSMSLLGAMEIKDRDSLSKSMSKIMDGKLRLMAVLNKSLAGVRESTVPVRPVVQESFIAQDEKQEDSSNLTAEFNKPIQNSAQVEKLLLGK